MFSPGGIDLTSIDPETLKAIMAQLPEQQASQRRASALRSGQTTGRPGQGQMRSGALYDIEGDYINPIGDKMQEAVAAIGDFMQGRAAMKQRTMDARDEMARNSGKRDTPFFPRSDTDYGMPRGFGGSWY